MSQAPGSVEKGTLERKRSPVEEGSSSPESSDKLVGSSVAASPSQTREERVSLQDEPQNVKRTDSAMRMIMWTVNDFLDWNPSYLIQVRGVMNFLHVILSLTTLAMLGIACQLRARADSDSEGFFCKPPDTFLFVVACSSFLTSVLYLVCCVLSKRTDLLLFHTSFEISYFILYFILFITASISLMISTINWESDRLLAGNNYHSIQMAAIMGLLNSIIYGISAVWFFLNHRYHESSQIYKKESSKQRNNID